ncbi:ATP-dependent DNA helicase PIF1-like protein [Tanacetum coccineum]|uniref:ATP-dependent DNA helicase PIF1-like protein n=1 Tax=Tanacetum coccineum TaxID=301880 RepID=A0ABQ5BED0_9ASTR
MGVTLDKRYNAKGFGVYTFRVQGGIYHRIDLLVPRDGEPRVELTASVKVDQKLYNRPTTSEVAGIWVEGNDNITTYKRSIVVYGRSEYPTHIQPYFVCYDPLSYPLFFPNGEAECHSRMPWEGVDIRELVNDDDDVVEDEEGTKVLAQQPIVSRAILSTKNEHVDSINDMLIDIFPGEEKVYYSFDEAEDDTHNYYPLEFLNSFNADMQTLCPNVINAEIVVGQHAGVRVLLPRIPLAPSEEDMFLFKLKRTQFPVRLSFAMTINKAQRQTIPNVGVYLPESVFSHGQLYVALSRGISRTTTKVLVKPEKEFDQQGVYTSNVVYQEVLRDE